MHSRIIELSLEPIKEDDMIAASDIIYDEDSTFIGAVADYVVDSDRDNDINWFTEYVSNSHPAEYVDDEEAIIFKDGFEISFFKKRFESFVEKAKNITLEEFAKDTNLECYKLKCLLEDKYSFYVWFEKRLITLDSFIRGYLETNKKYYLGGTIDYHF